MKLEWQPKRLFYTGFLHTSPERAIARSSYTDFPCIKNLVRTNMASKFILMSMKLYYGIIDQEYHIVIYKENMATTNISRASKKACVQALWILPNWSSFESRVINTRYLGILVCAMCEPRFYYFLDFCLVLLSKTI